MDLKEVLKGGGQNAVISCVAVLLGIGAMFLFAGPKSPSFKAGVMPRCESEFARDLLVRAIQQSPAAQQGFKVVRLGETTTFMNMANKDQSGYKPGNIELMICEGKVYTNAGEMLTSFNMKWIDPSKKDEVWLEIARLAP
ncbi:hypothetical protein ABIE88_008562 [Bradyrhizobium diazoefficiens]|uniref:hypothetical protein n=1 Tax=Bradyrhizobium TaxID=374 RepID=UPI003183EA8E